MSIHAVEQFYKRVIQSPVLQDRFKAATSEDAVLTLAVALGQEHGLDFTTADIQSWLTQQAAEPLLELQDTDLDAVSGGNALTYAPLVQLPPIV